MDYILYLDLAYEYIDLLSCTKAHPSGRLVLQCSITSARNVQHRKNVWLPYQNTCQNVNVSGGEIGNVLNAAKVIVAITTSRSVNYYLSCQLCG